MDLVSEIRDPEKTYSESRIPDPGVKKAPDPDPGSGSATLKDIQSVHSWIYDMGTEPSAV
jgi:hypothetical protein